MASHARVGRRLSAVGQLGRVDVHDRGARSGKSLPRHPVVMPAQQQIGLVRPARDRRHDHDDHRLGRAAAGAPRPPVGPPVDEIRPDLLWPASPDGAVMQEIPRHTLTVACQSRPREGLSSPSIGTNGPAPSPQDAAGGRPGRRGPDRGSEARCAPWSGCASWPSAPGCCRCHGRTPRSRPRSAARSGRRPGGSPRRQPRRPHPRRRAARVPGGRAARDAAWAAGICLAARCRQPMKPPMRSRKS